MTNASRHALTSFPTYAPEGGHRPLRLRRKQDHAWLGIGDKRVDGVGGARRRGADRWPDRSRGMGRRPAHHRLPPGAAADRRARQPTHRGLDPGHPRGPGGGGACGAAARCAAHPAEGAARLQGPGRPGQPDGGLRRRRAHRLQLRGVLHRRHQRCGGHQREPLQHRLGRPLAARGQRGRAELVGGDADPLVHRADAQGQRRQAADEALPGPRDRCHRRARRLAGGQLRAAALPVRLRSRGGHRLPAVAAGRDPVHLGPVRQRARRHRCTGRGGRVLEAQRPVPDDRHAQPGLRPGRKRRPGGQLRRHRDLCQRQAPVLHREPGAVRVHHAVRFQPAAVYPAHRRAFRRRARRGRHQRRGQGQRQPGGDQVRRVRGRGGRRGRAQLPRAAAGARLQHAEPGPDADPGRAPMAGSRGDRAGRGPQLAPQRALERAHAPARQPDQTGRPDHARWRRHAVGRLRDGPRLAPAVDLHALRQRSAAQRRRLPVAEQPQLRPLGSTKALPRTAGAVALCLQGLALAHQPGQQRPRRDARPATAHQPPGRAARWQRGVRPGQLQRCRRGRPAHARPWFGAAALQYPAGLRIQPPAQGTLGARGGALGAARQHYRRRRAQLQRGLHGDLFRQRRLSASTWAAMRIIHRPGRSGSATTWSACTTAANGTSTPA
ncbi:hypothetical protein QE438_001554 [Pseudoxanthomonas sp. SORGH_AS 997]|nr:hypothetical protein [Pseudoxanthomonas sp. SORGH_AS_0997]